MAYETWRSDTHGARDSRGPAPATQRKVAPGKRTLTAGLSRRAPGGPAPVQTKHDPAATAAREAQAAMTQQWLDMAVRPDLYVETTPGEGAGAEHDPASSSASPSGGGQAMAGVADGINLVESSETLTDEVESGSAEGGSIEDESGTSSDEPSQSAEGTSGPVQLDDNVTTPPAVTFGPIDYKTTPAGISSRIPPRRAIKVPVAITGGSKGARVDISIDGAGGSNGDGTLNGRASVTKKSSGSVSLKGTQQTAAGSAGKLSLVAKVAGAEVGRSNAFTICAIPTQVKVKYGGLITGTNRGIKMTTFNNADSGNVGDLDQVQMSEMVQYQNGTGCFAGITSGSNSGYLPANATPHGVDSHSTPVALVTGPGYIESVQGFKFKDARSGATDMGVAKSGFMITRTATQSGSGTKHLKTHKYGAATTVSGVSVQAGSGSASKKQKV